MSLSWPPVHNFPLKSRPLKPITVLFLQSVSLWAGNCFYNFITFKAFAYLDRTDRILPLCLLWSWIDGKGNDWITPEISQREKQSHSHYVTSHSLQWCFGLFISHDVEKNLNTARADVPNRCHHHTNWFVDESEIWTLYLWRLLFVCLEGFGADIHN